jgi:hypothetical protein
MSFMLAGLGMALAGMALLFITVEQVRAGGEWSRLAVMAICASFIIISAGMMIAHGIVHP